MTAERKIAILVKLAENTKVRKQPKKDPYRIPKAIGVATLGTALGAGSAVLANHGLKALAKKYPKFKRFMKGARPFILPALGAGAGLLLATRDKHFKKATRGE